MTEPTEPTFSYLPPERYGLWPAEFGAGAKRPLTGAPRRWRGEIAPMTVVFFLALLLYIITVPRTVALEDDALFIANLHFFGVAHPPGYPIHTFLGGIFYHLIPFAGAALKAHLFSAVAAAATCVALYAIVAMLVAGRLFPALAALAFAASKAFWSQAIIAEVYTLNTFFFFTVVALSMEYASGRHSGRSERKLFFLLAVVYGLGLANHYPLLVLASTGLALLVIPRLKNKIINIPLGAAVAAAAAMPFYLWMVWRSHADVPAVFYASPIETFEQFRFYLLREGYASVDTQSGVNWDDKLAFAKDWATQIVWQYTPLGFALALFGFGAMARSRYNWLWLCLVVSFLSGSVSLLFLLDFQWGYIAAGVFRVYHLLAYGIMAIWLAVGAAAVADYLSRHPILIRRAAGGGALFAVVLLSLIAHWRENDRSDYNWAETLALTKINSIARNAALFTYDDLDSPVGYLHYVEGVRPDIEVYSDQGLIYNNALYSSLIPTYPIPQSPQTPSKAAILRRFIEENNRPIYYHTARFQLFSTENFGSDFLGFYRRVDRDSPAGGVTLDDRFKQWLIDNLEDTAVATDRWTRFQQYETIANLISAVQSAILEGSVTDEEWFDIVRLAREKNDKARILTDFIRLEQMTDEERKQEAAWMDTFNLDDAPEIDKFGRGRFYLLRARLAEFIDGKDSPVYEASLKSALEEDERQNNPGVVWLLNYYAEREDRHCDHLELANRYYADINTMPPAILAQIRAIRQKTLC